MEIDERKEQKNVERKTMEEEREEGGIVNRMATEPCGNKKRKLNANRRSLEGKRKRRKERKMG